MHSPSIFAALIVPISEMFCLSLDAESYAVACEGDRAQDQLFAFSIVGVAQTAADRDEGGLICTTWKRVSQCPLLPVVPALQRWKAFSTVTLTIARGSDKPWQSAWKSSLGNQANTLSILISKARIPPGLVRVRSPHLACPAYPSEVVTGP